MEESGLDIADGMAELAHVVRTGPGRAGALADHLADRLWQRWGTRDDVALLVLHRAPDPGTRQAPRVHQYIHQADAEGLTETRAVLRQALEDWNMAALVDDVQLAAGELLVNVLLHTESGAVLTLEVVPEPVRRVRLWVKDRSSALAAPALAGRVRDVGARTAAGRRGGDALGGGAARRRQGRVVRVHATANPGPAFEVAPSARGPGGTSTTGARAA